ncbi:MAG: 30S ribosomal protein S6 [Verrucomicrobiae bacterium]|nr:30S ribosomal protein S6 [Verrucomicrobiae bacterium]
MKRYEGLFILNTAGKEDGVKDALDKISAEIAEAGGHIETVQKMERKTFARVADKRHSSGFYANVIFNSTPATVVALRNKFVRNDEVFRVIFTHSPAPKAAQ